MKSTGIIIFLITTYFGNIYSFVDLSYLKTLISKVVDDRSSGISDPKAPKEICDENQIMLHLAKMYIISPERVLLLLTSSSLSDSCKDVADTIRNINKTQIGCIPLSSENLYMKLFKTVKFFYLKVCEEESDLRKKLTKISDCLPELRDEFLDCEGSQDWYENRNQTKRCYAFSVIVDCNYVKTAMLCGLKPAATIRAFAVELFQQSQPLDSKCKVSRSLPKVDDPMPSSSNRKTIYSVASLMLYIYVLIKTCL